MKILPLPSDFTTSYSPLRFCCCYFFNVFEIYSLNTCFVTLFVNLLVSLVSVVRLIICNVFLVPKGSGF